MLRRIWTYTSALSLALCLATVLLWGSSNITWIRCGWITLDPQRTARVRGAQLDTDEREVTIHWQSNGLPSGGIRWYFDHWSNWGWWRRRQMPAVSGLRALLPALQATPGGRGVVASARPTPPVLWVRPPPLFPPPSYRSVQWRGSQEHYVHLPYWLVSAILAPLGLPYASLVTLRRVRRHRATRGRCPRCNYDLRATPDRCPECGTPAGTMHRLAPLNH